MKSFNINELNAYIGKSSICCEKHPEEDLLLYGYYGTPELKHSWDAINIHCRGLILNSEGEVQERPFPKFWTFRQYLSKSTILLSENRITKIPSCPYRITEKIDGTMVVLYWINDKPYLATQRSFTNIKAEVATSILYEKYQHAFNFFDRNYTYVFEAVYPETKVLIDYGDQRDLFLIGKINKRTGELMPLDNPYFSCAKDYTSEYKHITNLDDLANLNIPNMEGFVLQYENGTSIKLKFPWYSEAHRILDRFIHIERTKAIQQQKLRDLMGLQQSVYKLITTEDVINCLNEGDKEMWGIKKNLSDLYFSMGLENWLFKQQKRIENHKKSSLLDNKNNSFLEVDFFDIEERINQPHIYETTMWNWEKRFLE